MNTYDEIPYPIYSHSQTHPASLATLAILYGLTPPPVERCRVLELACASGGNLIPMALSLPESQFVGVDLSARQIGAAQAYASALGLKNVTFRHLDLLDLGDDFGQFDYLISHGLFSWVAPDAQDKILDICRRNLAPNGIAFVSYNTLPGWRVTGALRDLLMYHTRETPDPQSKTNRAQALLGFLAGELPARIEGAAGLMKVYTEFLALETQRLTVTDEAYLLHEMLEEINDPIYFSEFISRAQKRGLQFVSEMDFRAGLPANVGESLAQGLTNFARDTLEWEQYVDFIRGRTFRQTLLCHAGLPVSRTIKPETLTRLHAASSVRPADAGDIRSDAVQIFRDATGLSLSTDHPMTKAALLYLAEIYPRSAPFEKVFEAARALLELGPPGDDRAALDARMLCHNLLTAFTASGRLVELTTFSPRFVTEVSERPQASPWARIQAVDSFDVTNMRHERIDLDPVLGYLLPYLDGVRDRAALVDALIAGPIAAGKMTVKQNEVPLTDADQIRPVLAPEVDEALSKLARLALLIG